MEKGKLILGVLMGIVILLVLSANVPFVGNLVKKVTGLSVSNSAVTCTDSDDGKDASVKGEVRYTYNPGSKEYVRLYNDACFFAQGVKEYYCDSSKRVRAIYLSCDSACEDGACK